MSQPQQHQPQPSDAAPDALKADELDVVSGGGEIITNKCNQCEANWSGCSTGT